MVQGLSKLSFTLLILLRYVFYNWLGLPIQKNIQLKDLTYRLMEGRSIQRTKGFIFFVGSPTS